MALLSDLAGLGARLDRVVAAAAELEAAWSDLPAFVRERYVGTVTLGGSAAEPLYQLVQQSSGVWLVDLAGPNATRVTDEVWTEREAYREAAARNGLTDRRITSTEASIKLGAPVHPDAYQGYLDACRVTPNLHAPLLNLDAQSEKEHARLHDAVGHAFVGAWRSSDRPEAWVLAVQTPDRVQEWTAPSVDALVALVTAELRRPGTRDALGCRGCEHNHTPRQCTLIAHTTAPGTDGGKAWEWAQKLTTNAAARTPKPGAPECPCRTPKAV